jgi:hypothetical protein
VVHEPLSEYRRHNARSLRDGSTAPRGRYLGIGAASEIRSPAQSLVPPVVPGIWRRPLFGGDIVSS